MQKCALYRVVHRETGRGYVGISVRHAIRWNEHRRAARAGSPLPFHRALRKHGSEAFDWRVIAWSSMAGARQLEQIAVALGLGRYNATSGGQGTVGWKHTAAAKQKMREAALRRPPSRGWHHSAEAKAKMSALRHASGEVSQETRERLRAAGLGRKHSEETKAKIRAAHLGKKRTPEHRANVSKARRRSAC